MELNNFKVEELVSPEVYELLGDHAVNLLSLDFLSDVDTFVSDLKKDLGVTSVTVNNWLWGGNFTESGFRAAKTLTGAPGSAHKTGIALDIKFKGADVEACYNYLLKNQKKYPKIRRIESIVFTPTWLHVDGRETNKTEIHVFNP